ncbi:MAG: heterodisulfide reductase-related iron-sulfur binding cluster [Phycisphaerae bacterium]|nr:heterodisulfide reductase-related iron-sulfur binding cluster [Phycisphaerae bacterium]MDW8263206.1 heterodisulfide reductase-related iron-sulfur binding cluster [Phycisphaerales bacterium]
MNPSASNPRLNLDPRAYQRGLSCVHCGLCLPACPTYTLNGNEADSPRGRIQLMMGLADGAIAPTPAVRRHLDLCLDCRACETACPGGVVYHELLEETRARLKEFDNDPCNPACRLPQPLSNRLVEWLFLNLLTHPTRLKLSLLVPRVLQKLRLYPLIRRTGVFSLLPAGLAKMAQMLPDHGPLWPRRLPARTAPASTKKATVAMLTGCVGSVLFEKVNRQAVELLSACGAEVIVPPAQGCCGAMHHHNGVHEPALEMARRNIDALESADFVVSTIAGCGSMIREYDVLLRDDAHYAQRARAFVAKVRDITEMLEHLGLCDLPHTVDLTATCHDACHLIHAQKVSEPPRRLLAKVPGLKLQTLPEHDMCCGAAGTYNLTQPETAAALADRKLRCIQATGCNVCITGNVGCALHIQSQAAARGVALRVLHPVEVLHAAAFGSSMAPA